MPIDLVKLAQIVEIARRGSFTRAADALRVTQPALSRNVTLLEHRLGQRLFDRARGGVVPTAFGARVVEEAEALLRQAAAMEHNLDLHQRGEAGRLSLGMGPQVASLLLPALGAQMAATRPRLQLHCQLQTVDMLLPQLVDGTIELIVCASGHMAPSAEIDVERLGTIALGIMVRAGHPLTGRAALTVADLAPYPLAIEASQGPSFLAGGGGLFCENSHILREVVLGSDALWFSAPRIAAPDLAAGTLVALAVTDLPIDSVEIGLMHLARRRRSAAVMAVAEHLRGQMRAA